jgi:hypothetical protein
MPMTMTTAVTMKPGLATIDRFLPIYINDNLDLGTM